MRIVHIITDMDTGGAEMVLFRLLSSVDRSQFSSYVISLMEGGKIAQNIRNLNVDVSSPGMLPSFKIWRNFLTLGGILRWPSELRKVRRFQPEILQGWMYHGNLAAQAISFWLGNNPGMGRKARTPVFWNIRQSLHQLEKEKRTTSFLIHLGARLSHLPEKIVYNSYTSAAQHEKIGYRPEKRVVIPNGFDTQTFKPCEKSRYEVRREIGVAPETPLIGLIARFHPVKGHDMFLEAAARFHSAFPAVHFLLAGANVDRKNKVLTEWIQTSGIGEFVHLLGERADIPEITASLDVATSCSYAEAFSNAIGEAMSCGVPCVVTDVGDSAMVVGDSGIVVEVANPQSLAHGWACLIGMNQEERVRLGMKARERIVSQYSLQEAAARYQNLYRAKS